MLPRDSDKQWEAFGRNEPYYGVLSHERFRKDRLDDASLKEFFKSGQEHIDFVLETIRASLDSEFLPANALDFGCGVGRCAIPLTRICQSVLGVDVSDAMLQQARKICFEQSIANLTLVKSDDALSRVSGPFDFIHSFLVFQHIPPRRGEKIFTKLTQLLSDKGIAAVSFVYHREESTIVRVMGSLRKKLPVLHSVVNLLYGKPFSEPLMEKNVYDLNRLFAILHQNGCGNLHMRFFGRRELRNVILFFQKKRDNVPYDAYAYYF
jgi:SAM-dependent methyltransferase